MKSNIVASRRWTLLALLCVVALIAAACGRSDDDAGGSDGDDTAEESSNGDPQPVPGFDGTTIRIGALTPLTSQAALIGKPLNAGMRAWFQHLNADGGIAGKYKVEIVAEDTRYDAPTAVQLYDQMKGDVVMVGQAFGTSIVQALLPKLKTDGLVAQPASLDSLWVREQQLLPVGSPYQIQAINAIDYYLDHGGQGKKICALAADDAYGDAGLDGVEFAAKELDFDLGVVARFSVGAPDFTTQINQLKGGSCDMVFGVFTAVELSGILTAASTLSFAPQWIGQAPSWLSIFALGPLKDYLVQHFWVASEGPPWNDPNTPGMADMEADRATYTPEQLPDQYFVFGYAAARAVTDVLEAAVERGDLSREGIVEAMNSIDEMTYGGIFGGVYGWGEPEDRDPPRASTIFKVDPTKPYALDVVIQDHVSEAAEKFVF
jgi:ABC-type branched-subunit amino acid transport system substrate-binding protein